MKLERMKIFDHNIYEKKINVLWENKNLKLEEKNKKFSMIMPPPNITGQLHMGHALDNIIQDIIIRFKYLNNYNTNWVPGIDHAGIATQLKIESHIMNTFNKTRNDIDKNFFLQHAWLWKEKYSNKILEQQKKLGLLCNWENQRFTLDESYSKAVVKAFNILYNKKLIYKDKKIINWCTSCVTAISDIEVLQKEINDYLWYISYNIFETNDKIIIATTRPETIFADVAIAVNPNDNRYKKFIGKFAIIPIINKKIPIISDITIEKNFGTGCVKITPCHDFNDFEIAQKHNLEHISLFDKYGKINNINIIPNEYIGLTKKQALKVITDKLFVLNKIIKKENYKKNISLCYRCFNEIELMESEQWFVKMKSFTDQAISLINNKQIEFIPAYFSKTYIHWMINVHDWCISRQLWWGHSIPAYYCQECNNMCVSEHEISCCNKCFSANIVKDKDVLDTWFSSALFPLVAFGWPNTIKTFTPLDVLVTGYDIIFFWVARMIFMSSALINQIPFKKVLVHGIVRDQYGKKMSKFSGNGIDPIEIINKYGVDTLRFTLINNSSPGNDMKFDFNKIISSRNFVNKIWNIMHFIILNVDKNIYSKNIKYNDFINKVIYEDKWILNKYNDLINIITKNFNNFEFGNASINLYNFIWNEFCNWYIEIIKIKCNSINSNNSLLVMVYIFKKILIILHPIMPYITETIWNILHNNQTLIIDLKWPKVNEKFNFKDSIKNFDKIINIIKEIRKFKTKNNIKILNHIIFDEKHKNLIDQNFFIINKLTKVENFSIIDKFSNLNNFILLSTDLINFYILDNNINQNNQINILKIKKQKLNNEVFFLNSKLNNILFTKKAPEHLINKFKEKLEITLQLLEKINSQIKSLDEN